MVNSNIKINVSQLNIWFGAMKALKNVSLQVRSNEILSAIGPANSGKTSFLRCLNRLNDIQENFKMDGTIELDGKDVYRTYSAPQLRKQVGMVFAVPVPLPTSVFNNIAHGPKLQGVRHKKTLDQIVEQSLKDAYLWDEVKDRLHENALKLSGGQQQRLCIARTLAVHPDVILFDEPCSALDPISTAKIEEAMQNFKEKYTIVLVTNNTKQAARVSDRTAFFLMGELVELDETGKMFTAPRDKRTEDYISGRYG
jgi:phosphate transport system ATP-binding protein